MFNPSRVYSSLHPTLILSVTHDAERITTYSLRAYTKAGVQCLTIECAFDEDDFQLDERLDVIRVRS